MTDTPTPGEAHRAAVLAAHGDALSPSQRVALDRLRVLLDTLHRLDAALETHGEVNSYSGKPHPLLIERRHVELLAVRLLGLLPPADAADSDESPRSAAARRAAQARWNRTPK